MPKKQTFVSSFKKNLQSKKKKFIKNPLVRQTFGVVFLVLALIVIIFPYSNIGPKPVDTNPIKINSKLLKPEAKNSIPVRVIIPKSDIDLKVTPSRVVDGYWELSETTASYGLGSGKPGIKSNIVVFAHARPGLFYNLKNVAVGDTVYIFTENKWYKYKVNKITAVFPNQVEVIQPTKNETLTLYTCTGFADEKRLIVTALPQKD